MRPGVTRLAGLSYDQKLQPWLFAQRVSMQFVQFGLHCTDHLFFFVSFFVVFLLFSSAPQPFLWKEDINKVSTVYVSERYVFFNLLVSVQCITQGLLTWCSISLSLWGGYRAERMGTLWMRGRRCFIRILFAQSPWFYFFNDMLVWKTTGWVKKSPTVKITIMIIS